LKEGNRGRFRTEVLSNSRLNDDTVLLLLKRPRDFPDALPGQFISVRVSEETSPLLMRPYSIMSLSDDGIGILVKVVGRGSGILSEKKEGDPVSFVGPLGGNPFPEPQGGDVTMVAGGTGIAPMMFMISRWLKSKSDIRYVLLYGGDSSENLFTDLVDIEGVDVHFSTLDGSLGFHGDVVELCAELLSKGVVKDGVCYSCGPRGMVKALDDVVKGIFDAHYTSLEAVMACGVGACRGCTVPVREDSGSTLKTVCSDGPVFEARRIDWEGWTW